MYSVAAPIWNEIAEQQDLATDWAKQMFSLPQEDLDLALEREEARLTPQVGAMLAAVYLKIMPLLRERRAIMDFLKDNPNYRHALPEILDVGEAIMVANKDSHLSAQEQRQLRQLLLVKPI